MGAGLVFRPLQIARPASRHLLDFELGMRVAFRDRFSLKEILKEDYTEMYEAGHQLVLSEFNIERYTWANLYLNIRYGYRFTNRLSGGVYVSGDLSLPVDILLIGVGGTLALHF